jgi:hypothetical protein
LQEDLTSVHCYVTAIDQDRALIMIRSIFKCGAGVTIRNPVFRPQISIEATLQICSREDRRRIGWATRPISSLIDQVRDRSRVSSGTGSFPSPGSQRIRLIASTKILRSPWKINSPCSNIIIPVQPMKL